MNSRAKGARGEREWASWLRENLGMEARRGQQYAGGGDSPDVVGGIGGTHAEVKRVERLDLAGAVEQAVRDAAPGTVPYVAHRRNRQGWLVTVRAEDLVRLAGAVTDQTRSSIPPSA